MDELERQKQQALDWFVHFLQKYERNIFLIWFTLVFIIQKLLELYLCYNFFDWNIFEFYEGNSTVEAIAALALCLTARYDEIQQLKEYFCHIYTVKNTQLYPVFQDYLDLYNVQSFTEYHVKSSLWLCTQKRKKQFIVFGF